MKRGQVNCAWAAVIACCVFSAVLAQTPPSRTQEARSVFTVVVLGSDGGLAEGSTSAYLLARAGTHEYACLDGGAVLAGIRAAVAQGSLRDVVVPPESHLSVEGYVLRSCIKSYLISHAHMDHIEGLVQASTDDGKKSIIALPATLDDLVAHIFNWRTWPNFTGEGVRPMGKYTLTRAVPGQRGTIPHTRMTYEAFPLSHSRPYESTAFLVLAGENAVLYLGDTGPDAVESSECLSHLWDRVAPLVRLHRLAGIFIESSYADGRPDSELYGHLTPSWLLKELRRLASRVDPERPSQALRGLTVLVTHIKPSLEPGLPPRDRIRQQLETQDDMGLKFLFPSQGQRVDL